MFTVETRDLGSYELAVCGGGVAGFSAAVSAARNGVRVIVIESAGCLGGTLTDGRLGHIMDRDNKGGLVRELTDFLDAHGMTCARRGSRTDENGKRIPGALTDVEGTKYYLDKACADAGVKVLFFSRVAGVECENGSIKRLLISSEAGNYTLTAKLVIDATGNGNAAALAGCKWDCGDPVNGHPSPSSVGACVVGMPESYNGTDSYEEKSQYNEMLMAHGISSSAQQVTVVKQPSLKTWGLGFNFQYDVMPDDIHSMSDAMTDGRRECFAITEAHKKIEGYEQLYNVATDSHLGIREGRRIYGLYRLTDDDIIAGRRFEDGICLVTALVDVHKLKSDDVLECERGVHSKPYHIPYRCLVPQDVSNMLLAGRCISGDFYPHASYRMIGNMMAVGEAAGYAAALCIRENTLPAELDGRRVSEYMKTRGYEI